MRLAHKLTYLLSSLILLFFTNNLLSQNDELRFEHLTVADGLPNGHVKSIIQDHLGFIWFTTQNGLVKFNGFSNYYTMSVQAEYTTEEIIAPEFDDEIHYGEDLFDRSSKAAEAATIPAPDDFDEQVENAQRQLNALRHQQEMIERQKQELEVM